MIESDPPDGATSDRLLEGRAWDVVFEAESARCARYGRRSTLVLVAVRQADPTAGGSVPDRTLGAIEAILLAQSRSSDVLARLGPTRFAVLLTETDEISAINFVERVRSLCEDVIEAAGANASIAFGWAELGKSTRGGGALGVATGRLSRELGRDGDSEPTPTESRALALERAHAGGAFDPAGVLDVYGSLERLRADLVASSAGDGHGPGRDPLWGLDGGAKGRERRAEQLVRTIVLVLSATILGLVLVRLGAVAARGLVAGGGRPLLLMATTADAVACLLVFAHQVRLRLRLSALAGVAAA